MTGFVNKWVSITTKGFIGAGVASLMVACGGGGNTANDADVFSGPDTNSAATSFQAGTFLPRGAFQNLCAQPRTGNDPFNDNRPFPDRQGSVEEENAFLRSWTNELYLWYDEVEDQDPAAFSTPEYFDLMRTFATTPSGRLRDNFHFSQDTSDFLTRTVSGVSFGYGLSLSAISTAPPREFRIRDVVPGSPADMAGVRRGMLITAIDGEDFISGNNVDVLNAGLSPGELNEAHIFSLQAVGASTSSDFILTSANVTAVPVKDVSVISTASGDVGYVHFNAHTRPSEADLIDAFSTLEDAGVDDLVLDLRYNGGGLLSIAGEVGFMVAGTTNTRNQTFYQLIFNDQHPTNDPVTGAPLRPTPFFNLSRGFSEGLASGIPLPSLNLSRVYILSTSGTCSASEAIINGLLGVNVEVILIGGTTCGKPYGFYPQDNCGTTYFSVQFTGANAEGFGEYPDGFSPANQPNAPGVPLTGCLVDDDFTRVLGDPDEAMLAAALQYRATGTCPALPAQSQKTTGTTSAKPVDPSLHVTLPVYPELNNAIIMP